MDEERLPDDAIVLRGGLNETQHMREQAQEKFEDCGIYSLSVAADGSLSFEELAVVADFPNRRVRRTTVGLLRAIGCDVTPPSGRKRHANLILPQPPTDDVWKALEEAFAPAEPNPARRRRG